MQNFSGVFISPAGKLAAEAELAGRRTALRKLTFDRPSAEAVSAGNSSCGVQDLSEYSRQEQILRTRVDELTRLLTQATIADVPTNTKTLAIGHVVSLSYSILLPGRKSKHVRELHEIVGYGEGDCNSSPPKLSYLTQLAQAFIGESKGHKDTVWRGGRPITMTLTNIQFPNKLSRSSRAMLGDLRRD